MPEDVDAEAWCDDIIVEDSDSMETSNRMVAFAVLAGPAMARTSVHDEVARRARCRRPSRDVRRSTDVKMQLVTRRFST
jgi:hypothetical protein